MFRFALLTCLVLSGCDGGGDDAAKSANADAKTPDASKSAAGNPFTDYQRKSMATEAAVNVRAIAESARASLMEETIGPDMKVASPTLPSAPMTPAAGSCCKRDGGTCPPDDAAWDHPGWKALNWRPSAPHRYSYEFLASDKAFTVRATGDLDCDGEMSTFELAGTIGPDGTVELAPELAKTNEIE